MPGITTTIDASKALAGLNQDKLRMNAPAVNAVAGRAVYNDLQEFFRIRNQQPNKQGFPKTGFFLKVASGTSFTSDANAADININAQGFAQRLFGGDITPKDGNQFLTVPAIAQAYGTRAREHDLAFARVHFPGDPEGTTRPALVNPNERTKKVGRKRKDGTQREIPDPRYPTGVWYWLVRRVHQEPDPTVLPTEEHMITVAANAVTSYFAKFGLN